MMTEQIMHEIEKGLDRKLTAGQIADALDVTVDEVNEVSKDYVPCDITPENPDAEGSET